MYIRGGFKMLDIKNILNKIARNSTKTVSRTTPSLEGTCYTYYVLCFKCPVSRISPIYSGDNDENLIEAISECRNSGSIAREFIVIHKCDEEPDLYSQLTEDYLDELWSICDKTGKCCIGVDFGDGCDPVAAGCADLTAEECSQLGEAYEDTGIITYWVGDEGLYSEPQSCEDSGHTCFDENYDSDNNPENFQYCCVPGRPNPVDTYQAENPISNDNTDLPMTECRCSKIGGSQVASEDLVEDLCGNRICPGSLQSQNEVVPCCIKYETSYVCASINRCECDASRIPGASSATVMENGCFDNPDYPKCNCCERNAQLSSDYEIDETPVRPA